MTQGLVDPAEAAASEEEIEVSQENWPDIENPDEVVHAWDPETNNVGSFPRHAYEQLWKERGWVEYDINDPSDTPWLAAEADGAPASDSEEVGAEEDSEAEPESKVGAPPPSDKE